MLKIDVLIFFIVDADQSSVAPEIIITSTYWNWGPMLLRFVDMMAEDKWPGDFIYWGLREVCNVNINSFIAVPSLGI